MLPSTQALSPCCSGELRVLAEAPEGSRFLHAFPLLGWPLWNLAAVSYPGIWLFGG